MQTIRIATLAGGACLAALVALVPLSAAVDAPVADAAMRQDAGAVRTLVTGDADPDAAHGDGMTGLHWAAHNGDVDILRVLLAAGADVEARTRLGDHTPLHVASRSAQAAAVRELLEAGAEANAIATTGATPLHFAAASGSAGAVAALLDHGADGRRPRAGVGADPVDVRGGGGARRSHQGVAGAGRRPRADRRGRRRRRPQRGRPRGEPPPPRAGRGPARGAGGGTVGCAGALRVRCAAGHRGARGGRAALRRSARRDGPRRRPRPSKRICWRSRSRSGSRTWSAPTAA